MVKVHLEIFFNIVLNGNDRSFKPEYLRQKFPNASADLFYFYEKNQQVYDQVNLNEMRSLWAEVVSGHDGVKYQKKLYDIAPNGLSNVLAVFSALLCDKKLDELIDNRSKLDYIFESFSRPNFRLDWIIDSNNNKDIKSDYFNLIITINGEHKFIWKLTNSHFELMELFDDKINYKKSDWRKGNHNLLSSLCNSSIIGQDLLNALLAFYLPSQWLRPQIQTLKALNSEQKRLVETSFFYGMNLSGSEQKLTALNIAAILNSEMLQKLALKWLEAMPEDYAIDKKLLVAYFNLKEAFKGFSLERGERLLDKIFSNGIDYCLDKIDRSDIFSLSLIKELLLKQDFFVSANKSLEMILFWAAEHGHREVVEFLVEKSPDIAGKKDSDGKNPLFYAVKHGHQEVIEFLVEKSPNLASSNDIYNTPLVAADERGHVVLIGPIARYMLKENLEAVLSLGLSVEAAEIVRNELKERNKRLIDS